MIILITIISIIAMTGIAWTINKLLNTNVCPICAGVASTWLWMLALRTAGYAIDPITIAILMGGSIVGISYKLEKYIENPDRALLWQAIFIPTGFAAVYSIIVESWNLFFGLFVILLGTSMATQWKTKLPKNKNGTTQDLEDKMKHCC